MADRRLPAVAAMILALGLLAAPATAQDASGSNPTAQAASEQQLFEELNKIQGRVTIPNPQAATLEQPQGRDFRAFHEGTLPWIAGIAILGMLAVIAVFYFVRGRIRTKGPKANVRIVRFNAIERFAHWLTATAFIVLAITGLNFIFGKRLLMPLIGADAFASWSQWAKYAHDFFAWAFILGALMHARHVGLGQPARSLRRELAEAGRRTVRQVRQHPSSRGPVQRRTEAHLLVGGAGRRRARRRPGFSCCSRSSSPT